MAKKSYQNIEADWAPEIINRTGELKMEFTGRNSKGTRSKITITIQKGAIHGMIVDIVKMFKADAESAAFALKKVKEAAL